jgi:hypothetical protein
MTLLGNEVDVGLANIHRLRPTVINFLCKHVGSEHVDTVVKTSLLGMPTESPQTIISK